MFKKLTTAFTASAIAVLGLVSIVSASTGDSFDITGLDHAGSVASVSIGDYSNFTIANGDPNEEGVAAQVKVQPRGLSATEEMEDEVTSGDYTNFTIANGDPNEEGESGQTKVQPAPVVEGPSMLNIGGGDESDQPTRQFAAPKLNIGASDPAEQD